jgi:glycosyltransferase involved in cell wall biosynthesis
MTQLLCRALSGAGHDVRSVGVYPMTYSAPDYEEDGGVRVWRLREPTYPFGWLQARWRLYRLIANWARYRAVDLVEAPDYQGWTAGWRRLNVPLVIRLHGSETYFAAELGRPVNLLSFWLERTALNRADFWCSVCQYTAERTRSLFRLRTSPSAILYNPVEFPEAAPSRELTGRKVVFTGTLTPKKGVISLIRSWPSVIEDFPDAELHIYGKDGHTDDGAPMQAYLESTLPAAIRRTVRFHGHVHREDLLGALASARAAVFPSYAEAFAVAPLEAMAAGCPTICSRRGAGSELLKHGCEGLLIDPDNPDEIAAAISRVLGDEGSAERLGANGRQRVWRDFSTSRLLGQNVDFYRDCLVRFAYSRA